MAKTLKQEASITYLEAPEVPSEIKDFMALAIKAATQAYAPYSQFEVGAAVKLKNGEIVLGNNQENAVYPAGLCAERVAFFAAKANHPEEDIEAVAIAAKAKEAPDYSFASPCGSCRQVMSEYENSQKSHIKLYLAGEKGSVYMSQSIDNLLPFKFSDENLSN